MTHQPDQEFEAYYAAIRSPLQNIAPPGTKRVADAIANGDIAWLDRALQNPQLQKSGLEGSVQPTMVYALAHWLVDGSGREDFARRWMEVCGHTQEKASGLFLNILNESDLHDPLVQQKVLGLATLVEMFSQNGSEVGAAGMEYMTNLDAERGTDAPVNRTLAAILRMQHPESPPNFIREDGSETPLIELLWTTDVIDSLLPSIGQAYGRGNPDIEAQMRAGAHKHIELGLLATIGGDRDCTWDQIAQWGGPGIGSKIWEANARSHQFPFMAILEWCPEVERHMDYVLANGVSIDAPIDITRLLQAGAKFNTLTSDVSDTKCTALELAIDLRKPAAVAWLLENGADHTVTTQTNDPGQQLTPLERAQSVDAETQVDDDAKQALSVLQSGIAKRAAMDAIRELGLDTAAPRP